MSGPHGSAEPAVFEATGSNGKRMVGFLNMVQKEVDAADYDTLWAGGSLPDAIKEPTGRSGDKQGGR